MNSPARIIESLWSGPSQDRRALRLHTVAGADALVAETLRCEEQISAGGGYRLELTALARQADAGGARWLGTPASLELHASAEPDGRRVWHGFITAISLLGANQGLARYRLVIEPWLALLGHRRDRFIHRNRPPLEIISTVFSRYAALSPAWKQEIAEPEWLFARGTRTQFDETDLAFVHRLLADYGLFCWFEPPGAALLDDPQAHQLVIADHNQAFSPRLPKTIRLHRADAAESRDGIQRWQVTRARAGTSLFLSSPDYRTATWRSVGEDGAGESAAGHHDRDAGQYAFPHRRHAEHRRRCIEQAERCRATRFTGSGSWSAMRPGLRFQLLHAGQAQRVAVCTGVTHRARNNLSERVFSAIAGLLGAPAHGPDAALGEGQDYRNEFLALPADMPFRPRLFDANGAPVMRRPRVSGLQTAVVVGPPGSPVFTDRDHRIQVQFDWQRGSRAENGLTRPDGADNASGRPVEGAWIRVVTPIAGANWGTHFLPRVGQSVLLRFIDGDIDRPVVTGASYNGRGQRDGAGNQQAGGRGLTTPNAPAWFAGQAGPHAHAAVLSGFKTQALSGSQTGHGGHNQLLFDDSPGESGLTLATTEYDSGLSLGHLKQRRDNARLADRGRGLELSTRATGALRAGSGLLLAAERSQPGQLFSPGVQQGLGQSSEIAQGLADRAEAQQGNLPGETGIRQQPALDALAALRASVRAESGQVTAWTRPDLGVWADAGVVGLASEGYVMAAGAEFCQVGRHLMLTAEGRLDIAAVAGLRLFVSGASVEAGGAAGIALHAATGPLSWQASSGAVELSAAQQVAVTSQTAEVRVQAPHIRLRAAGAGLEMSGMNITLTAPESVTFEAGQHQLAGPAMVQPPSGSPAHVGPLSGCRFRLAGAEVSGEALVALD